MLGLLLVPALIWWIHHAEFRLGGTMGHTALANTALPVAAFFTLMVLTLLNGVVARLNSAWALTQGELLTVYALTAATTGIASSGGVHFLVPALTAPIYYATPENNWHELILPHIPSWFIPHDRAAVIAFYTGSDRVPWGAWVVPSVLWSGFLFVVMVTTLCLVLLLWRQWIERERLAFPTAQVPLLVTQPQSALWRSKSFWLGFAIAFGIGTWNTLARNLPILPLLDVRGERLNLADAFTERPFNAIGWTPAAFYPFVIGIGYLLSTEMTLSCWLFYLLVKLERIVTAALGWDAIGRGGFTVMPYTEHQGAGAFLAIALLSLWSGRKQLLAELRSTRANGETIAPRMALWGFLIGFGMMLALAVVAGMRPITAAVLLVLSLLYMAAATRLRAEVGNAWLFGPRVDPNTLVTTAFGTAALKPRELTVMAFLRNITTFDLRCLPMPHQLDAIKFARTLNLPLHRLVGALVIGSAVAAPFAFVSAVKLLYRLGAAAKADAWRVSMGRQPFNELEGYLRQPLRADAREWVAIGAGFAVTVGLTALRAHWLTLPLHPFGYAVANTHTMDRVWLPFMIAWAVKGLVLRYFGGATYRALVPFFVGLILGDFAHGGLWTLVGCLVPNFRVYPMNW
ncbi:hypothetical protein HRbin17_00377 [bacterium HR17]|uniref:Uncharacterized protein n=1 Tax=Candidatus Fervidibacter japonicus TaxID=2035412 RepID=A0A2H5X9L1_9BACT|nr:hypothetical protein HRbin17_00377 [bacterium HR17]